MFYSYEGKVLNNSVKCGEKFAVEWKSHPTMAGLRRFRYYATTRVHCNMGINVYAYRYIAINFCFTSIVGNVEPQEYPTALDEVKMPGMKGLCPSFMPRL